MIDCTGRFVTLIRDDVGVSAIAAGGVAGGDRPIRQVGGKTVPADPPLVIVRPLIDTPSLGGPGTDRTGMQLGRLSVLCFGPKAPSGARQARSLAMAVINALHRKGPLTFPMPGGGAGLASISLIRAESAGGPLDDPSTGEPYVPVVVTFIASGIRVA